jgi:hypothetical protein
MYKGMGKDDRYSLVLGTTILPLLEKQENIKQNAIYIIMKLVQVALMKT